MTPPATRRAWVVPNRVLSVGRQCELCSVSRSSVYYEPARETDLNLELMRLMDEQYLKTPFYGSRKMAAWLGYQGHAVNRKRTQRLMRKMGLEAIYQTPRLTVRDAEHEIYPYLLRNVPIQRPDQVWSTDITYVPMAHGFLYLVAIIDWYSRYVIAWELSNSLDTGFCIDALAVALSTGRKPEIFNTDQGCQFTSKMFTQRLKDAAVQISMDGRGRALDNVFIERLWRTVKYEEIYLHAYDDGFDAHDRLAIYFPFYNDDRPHQSLAYKTPKQVYLGEPN